MTEAIVALIRRGERVLVIRRSALVISPGYWGPLSGRIEPGESQPETVVREVREEIGLDVRPVAKVWECPSDDGACLLHWWSVEVTGGELRLEPREVSDVSKSYFYRSIILLRKF